MKLMSSVQKVKEQIADNLGRADVSGISMSGAAGDIDCPSPSGPTLAQLEHKVRAADRAADAALAACAQTAAATERVAALQRQLRLLEEQSDSAVGQPELACRTNDRPQPPAVEASATTEPSLRPKVRFHQPEPEEAAAPVYVIETEVPPAYLIETVHGAPHSGSFLAGAVNNDSALAEVVSSPVALESVAEPAPKGVVASLSRHGAASDDTQEAADDALFAVASEPVRVHDLLTPTTQKAVGDGAFDGFLEGLSAAVHQPNVLASEEEHAAAVAVQHSATAEDKDIAFEATLQVAHTASAAVPRDEMAVIGSLQSVLDANGYTLAPSLADITGMSSQERREVCDLKLARKGAGSVQWELPLDLTGGRLEQTVGNIKIEPCGLTVVSRELLWCHCLVTLESVRACRGTDAEQQAQMRGKVEQRGEEFVGFDAANKTVQFRIYPVGSSEGVPSANGDGLASRTSYVSSPSQRALQQMDQQQLSSVENFSVSRSGVGTVLWRDSVDLREVDVDRDVVIECGRVHASGKLNRPCTVLLENIRPSDGKSIASAAAIKEFVDSLRDQIEMFGGKFVKYEVESGEFAASFERFKESGQCASKASGARHMLQQLPSAAPPRIVRCTRGHACAASEYNKDAYINGWICSECGASGKAERWFCEACSEDYCYECQPLCRPVKETPPEKLGLLTAAELVERLEASQEQVHRLQAENDDLKSRLEVRNHDTAASGDAMREFFVMTLVAANLRRPFESRVNSDNDELFKEVEAQGVPMWDWAEWIEKRLWFPSEWADWIDAITGPDEVPASSKTKQNPKSRICTKG